MQPRKIWKFQWIFCSDKIRFLALLLAFFGEAPRTSGKKILEKDHIDRNEHLIKIRELIVKIQLELFDIYVFPLLVAQKLVRMRLCPNIPFLRTPAARKTPLQSSICSVWRRIDSSYGRGGVLQARFYSELPSTEASVSMYLYVTWYISNLFLGWWTSKTLKVMGSDGWYCGKFKWG